MQNHHDMLADKVRMSAFSRAISLMVRKGDAVLDAGAGTGVLGVAAALAGARKVYAVEKHGAIDIARRLAEENGCADRMEFLRGDVREIELPELVDGLICEMIGPAGVGEGIAEIVADARERLLNKGGWTIPATLSVFAAPVCDEGMYGWLMLKAAGMDMKMDALRDELAQNMWVEDLSKAGFSSAPAKILEIDFARERTAPRAPERGSARFAVALDCELNGMGCWFSSALAPGVEITTSPDDELTHWRQAFFPLRSPMRAAAGDEIEVALRAIPTSAGDIFYWKMEHYRNGERIGGAAMSNALASTVLNVLRTEDNWEVKR